MYENKNSMNKEGSKTNHHLQFLFIGEVWIHLRSCTTNSLIQWTFQNMGTTRDQKRLQTLQEVLPWQRQHRHRTYETDTEHPHQASYLLGRHLFRPLIKRWSTASRLLQIWTKTRNQNTTHGMENQSRKSRKKIISATLTSLSFFIGEPCIRLRTCQTSTLIRRTIQSMGDTRNQKCFRVSKATSTKTNGNGKKESETSHSHQIPHLLRRLLCRTPTTRWKNTLILVQIRSKNQR